MIQIATRQILMAMVSEIHATIVYRKQIMIKKTQIGMASVIYAIMMMTMMVCNTYFNTYFNKKTCFKRNSQIT